MNRGASPILTLMTHDSWRKARFHIRQIFLFILLPVV
jgi:hypothetical protein